MDNAKWRRNATSVQIGYIMRCGCQIYIRAKDEGEGDPEPETPTPSELEKLYRQ